MKSTLHPAVIFDIDSTIMNTEPRNQRILAELASEHPEFRDYLKPLALHGIGWNIARALEREGLSDPTLLSYSLDFWKARFFHNDYVISDEPYPEAIDCVKELEDEGFHILLVTGRDEPGMGIGTRAHFAEFGLEERETLRFFLKPDFAMSDVDFKGAFCTDAAQHYSITATMENEPKNANLFNRTFPDALHIFIETITSPDPEPLDTSIIRARWF